MQASAGAEAAGALAARDAYDRFAFAYDTFTAGYAYERWFSALADVAAAHGFTGGRVLDVACGTGKSVVPWLERGYDVTACDISEAMLERARLTAPGARFVRADMRALPHLGEFELVTCIDDGLNYLGSARDLGAALQGIARNLAPGGIAVWDVNTLAMYRTEFATDRAVERDGMFIVWRGGASADHGPGEPATAVVDIFRGTSDGRWERTSSVHRQCHWTPATVSAGAQAAGLRLLAVHGQLPGARLEPELDERIHPKAVFVARRDDEEVNAMSVGRP